MMTDETGSRQQISIAMATFNGEKYLREQLASLAAQTMLPRELVVTDDGSADATIEILEDFAAAAPFPVILYRNETRLGYGPNFLKAATLCTGSLIAFCDQDDVWMPQKLLKSAELFRNADILLVLHAVAIINADGASMKSVKSRAVVTRTAGPHAFFLWDFVFRGCTMTVRKEVVLLGNQMIVTPSQFAECHLDYPGSPISHDAWIYFLVSFLGKMVFLDERLIKHRRHGRNTSGLEQSAALPRHLRKLVKLRQPRMISVAGARRLYLLAEARHLMIEENASICRDAFASDVTKVGKIYERVAELYLLKYLFLKERRVFKKMCLLSVQCGQVCRLFFDHRLNFAGIVFQSLLRGLA